MSAEEAVWASVPYNYAAATRAQHAQRIAEDVARRLLYPVESAPYTAQLVAAMAHDMTGRLQDITADTLIVHGNEDRMVPAENARLLADVIPRAELRLLPGAGHLYFTDKPAADHLIAKFLQAS